MRGESKVADTDVSKPMQYEKEIAETDISKPLLRKTFEEQVLETKQTFETMISKLEKHTVEIQLSKEGPKLAEKTIETKVFKPIPYKKGPYEAQVETERAKLSTTKIKHELSEPKPFEKQTIEIKVKGKQPREYFAEIKPQVLAESLLPKPTPYEKQMYTVEFPDSEPETKPTVAEIPPATKPVIFKKTRLETKVEVPMPSKREETKAPPPASVKFAEVPEKVEVKKVKPAIHKPRPRSYDEADRAAKKVQKRSVSFDENVKTDESMSEAEIRRVTHKPSEITVTGVEWTTSDESTDEAFTKVVRIRRKQSPPPERLIIEGDYFPKKQRRVRTRKIVRKRTRADYRPVPYVPAPATTWVPERTDVLKAVEIWARYRL